MTAREIMEELLSQTRYRSQAIDWEVTVNDTTTGEDIEIIEIGIIGERIYLTVKSEEK